MNISTQYIKNTEFGDNKGFNKNATSIGSYRGGV